MRKKRRLKRIFSFLFFVTYITNHLYTTAYAATATPATASNAEFPPLSSSFITPELQPLGLSTYSAVSPAVSLDPSSYVLSLLLNSMGIDVSLSALSSWVGSTETYQDYVSAGEQGTLSAWEQWCYDQAKAEGGQALKDSYESNIEWLGKLSWGDTVETIPTEKLHSSAKSLNDWTRTFPSYGTDNTLYKRPTAVQERPPFDRYPDFMSLGWYYVSSGNDSTYGKYDEYRSYFINANYTLNGKKPNEMYTSNASYENLVGYVDSDMDVWLYDCISGLKINGFERSDFRYYYLTDTYRVVSISVSASSPSYVPYVAMKNTPIPIFSSKEEMYAYTSGGHADAINGKDKSGLKAKAVNPALQKTSIGALKGLTLPSDEETAKKQLANIDITSNLDQLLEALSAAGLSVTSKKPLEMVNYNDLSYVLKELCSGVGIDDLQDSVIKEWIDVEVGDDDIVVPDDVIGEAEEIARETKAEIIFKRHINKSGTNDDNSKNKFSVSKKMLASFITFLIASGLSDTEINFQDTNNIRIIDSIVPDPDPGDSENNIIQYLSNLLNEIKLLPKNYNDIIKTLNDFSISIKNEIELLPNKISYGFLETFTDIQKNFIDVLSDIKTEIKNLPQGIKDKIPTIPPNVNDTKDGDSSYDGYVKFILALVYIPLILIVIFFNCLRLILAIFHIPASSNLFNDDFIKGIQFTKELQLPLLGISLYALLIGLVEFLCAMAIIRLLKRAVNNLDE